MKVEPQRLRTTLPLPRSSNQAVISQPQERYQSAVEPLADQPMDRAGLVNCPQSALAKNASHRAGLLLALSLLFPCTMVLAGSLENQKLAESFGVTTQQVETVQADSKNAQLASLPSNLQSAWKSCPPALRAHIDADWTGSTAGYSKHSAFIHGGKIFFHDVFKEAQTGVDDSLKNGKMTQPDHDGYIAVLKAAAPLTPESRQAFIALMDESSH